MSANCQFCQLEGELRRGTTDWYHCLQCKFFFKGDGSEVCFRPNTKEYLYWMIINFTINQTEILCQRNPDAVPADEFLDQGDVIYKINKILTVYHAVQGVTPQNAPEKLKTLLMFS